MKRKVRLAYGREAEKWGQDWSFKLQELAPIFLFANFALTFRRFLDFPRMSAYYIAIDHSFCSAGHREYYRENRFPLAALFDVKLKIYQEIGQEKYIWGLSNFLQA